MDLRKRKHAGVLTIGILQLLLGCIGLLGELSDLSGVSRALWGPQDGSSIQKQKEVEDAIPYYELTRKSFQGVSLVLSVLMLVSGAGLVQMKPWSRRVTIWYAILSIIKRVIYSTYYATILFPVFMDLMEKEVAKTSGPNAQAVASMARTTSTIGIVILSSLVIYPIMILLMMTRSSVKAALSGMPVETFDWPLNIDYRRESQDSPSGEPNDRYRERPEDQFQA